jgi:hypothetical protein
MTTGSEKRLSSRRYGLDFIVDILRQYGIPYTPFNPGASFHGIHDSLDLAQRRACARIAPRAACGQG